MFAKQLTVFVENKLGSLSKVLGVLKENNVNILSMSLADTTEFGLLRLIVTNAAVGQEKLSERGYSALLSDVSIITVSHEVGSLQNLLEAINEKGVSIEYMYGLSMDTDKAYVVLKASDAALIDQILTEHGIKTLSCEDLAKL